MSATEKVSVGDFTGCPDAPGLGVEVGCGLWGETFIGCGGIFGSQHHSDCF
jgi:hypothetical protein